MSSSGERDAGGKNEDVEADEAARDEEARSTASDGEEGVGELVAAAEEPVNYSEEGDAELRQPDNAELEYFAQLGREDETAKGDTVAALEDSPDLLLGPATPMPLSPLDSGSVPDDTPSLRGSLQSSPGRAVSPLPRRNVSRTPSGALQPFERRFDARISGSSLASPRAGSPAFLNAHSRQVSLSSQVSQKSSQAGDDLEASEAPWEVVRWTKLRKITGQAFSEVGKRNFGKPTCLAVSATIAIGTSKGLILVFDYHQTLKNIMGQGTKATECGSITTLAISADYSTIAGGHANGWIFTWELAKPARPFLQMSPLDRNMLGKQPHPDGHVEDTAVLHLGFLGTRHTALVSADSGGMAFSHLATRGLGSVARVVKTTRLLGRYPLAEPQAEPGRKPSSVLAFSPLPLGNVEQATDSMGLTALLTPYLLVIVSTTPIAQTQHKSSRPKEISPHSALSGCLAWFPAVKLKTSSEPDHGVSDTKLVYCWSNVLTILDVKIIENADPANSQKPPNLEFHPRSRWRAEEAVVAVQWLSRSVLGVLTISQRLLIFEDGTLRMTDSLDLLQKHIYHTDLFSAQLHSVVERLESDDPSLHGVVADAFYMSFRVYKGRTFLLGFNDVAVGTLSNWADRLLALMETGDHIAAIRLATMFYTGGANNLTVGLPDDDETRHELVREKILQMMDGSLKFTFAQKNRNETRLKELAGECLASCISIHETDFLFDDVYEWFEGADEESVFVTALEPYILEGDITTVPPPIVKAIISHFIGDGEDTGLEELLCRLDPHAFDLDQITTLCKQHNLYDALTFVWTQGLGDYVTPLIDLLSLVGMLGAAENGDQGGNPLFESANKVFPYLAFSLTGRRYPSGSLMEESEADHAKADLYEYIFAGKSIFWPPGGRKIFRPNSEGERVDFPYLTLLLGFDTSSLMSMLNEAFEDPFLNGAQDMLDGPQVNGITSRPGYKMTRQHIISILLDLMANDWFEPEQRIYLDMFIARSLPKYPQHLVLSGSLLNGVLERLCDSPSERLAEDCQLSVEYLLSVHHPPNTQALISELKQARYFRVLKSTYRSERLYPELIETYFEDFEDREGVFETLARFLRPGSGLTEKQIRAVKRVVGSHFQEMASISVTQTARTLAAIASDLLEPCLDAMQDTHVQFIFLRALLEPALLRDERKGSMAAIANVSAFQERYVQQMCKHDPSHVADYVGVLSSADLRLDQVLPAMESSGVIDAAVVLLARDGMVRDAMDRLVKHLRTLEQALVGLIGAAGETPDATSTREAAEDIVEAIGKYTKVGLWLCQGQSATAQTTRKLRPRTNLAWNVKEDDLDLDEFLWVNLLDAIVTVSKSVSEALRHATEHPSVSDNDGIEGDKITSALRSDVQQSFTALLASTATSNVKQPPATEGAVAKRAPPQQDQQRFLRVLRGFLTRASLNAPTLADLRAVLADIFSAYTFESSVISLANQLLGSDVFVDIKKANVLRQRGWRPRMQVCERCKRRAWGPGIGELIWDEYVARESEREAEKARKAVERSGGEEAKRMVRGKSKAGAVASQSDEHDEERRKLSLVVFACRHVFHRVCLDEQFREGKQPSQEKYKCPLCTNES